MTSAGDPRLDRLRVLFEKLSAPDPPPSEDPGDEVWDVWTDRYMADDVLAGMLSTALHLGRHSPPDIAAARAESRRAGSRLSPEELEGAYRLLGAP